LFTLAHAAEQMESDGEFSHTNYYLRLAEVTGSDRSRLSMHGRSTVQFWRAFSSWLASTNYAHGRPTARQISSQKYVSLAISQAIVRAEDRHCFHNLFQKYGFTSSDEVSLDEMGQYIASWVHGTGSNKRLKAAWSRPELRPRICEVVLAELSEWRGQGADEQGQATSSARLSLAAAVLPGFPRRRLSLAVGRKWQGEEAINLHAGDGATYILDNALYGGFATLSSSSGLQMPKVLADGLSLASIDERHRHEWRPRLVIPFARSPTGPFWTEVTRASIGTDHIVIVRDHPPIRRDVDAILDEAAIPGYTCAEASGLAGLPAGWLLYEGVRLMRPPAEAPKNAVDLAPLAQAAVIRIDGGMAIGPRTWHRRAPPTVRLDGTTAAGRLHVHEGIDEEGTLVAEAVASNGSALVDLSHVDLPVSGNLFVVGTDGKSEHTDALLVRSARRPKPLDRGGAGILEWKHLDSATDAAAGATDDPIVVGMSTSGRTAPLLSPTQLSLQELGSGGEPEPAGIEVDEAPQPPGRRVVVPSAEVAATMSCGERAHHWYDVEFVPPEAPKGTPVALECRDCGHAYIREGGVRSRTGPVMGSRTPRQVPRPPPPPAMVRARRPLVDLDLLLDALSFMGSGSWASFEALVADGIEQPWEAVSLADDLSALGFLELRRSRGDSRIRSWCIPPPAIGLSPAGVGLLSGFRNEPLLEQLSQRVIDAGGHNAVEVHPGQPALVSICGLDVPLLETALTGLADPHGRPVSVIPDAAARLAGTCMAMAPAGFSLLEPATLGRVRDVESYDLETHRWQQGEVNGPGAYRIRNGGTSYFFRDANAEAWRGPHATIKLLAARAGRARLHAYDEASQCMESVLGCEPPGLLARALVACTGRLPLIAGNRLRHEAVPADIASTVLGTMYPGVPH
jgi:hypothetical protein